MVEMSEPDISHVRGVALVCSPRPGGNTDLLVVEYVRGMTDGDATVKIVYIRDRHIEPCRGCEACSATGSCVIDDDMTEIFELIESSDRIVLATPVFFYQTSSLAAKVIERSQPFWVRKYLLDNPPAGERHGIRRLGAWLAVGATRGERLFDGMRYTARYFFDALNADLHDMLTYRGLDEKGSIREHPTAMNDAYTAGRRFADPNL